MLSKFGVEADLCRRYTVIGGWDMVLFFPGLASSSQTLVLFLAVLAVLSSPRFKKITNDTFPQIKTGAIN